MLRESAYASLMGVRAQGATEYLLILIVALIIVATAVFYLTTTPPSAMITGTAEKSGDNVVFTPSTSMTPSTISAADWSWAVYHYATKIASGSGTEDLKRGVTVSLPAADATSGDKVKIKYGDTWYDAATVV